VLLNRERADRVMDEHGLGALVASTPLNVYYLTDWQTEAGWSFPGVSAALVPRDHERPAAVLTIDVDTEFPQARDDAWVEEVRPYHGMSTLVLRHERALVDGALIDDPPELAGEPCDPTAAVAAYLEEIGLADARVGFEDPWFGERVRDAGAAGVEVVPGLDLLRSIRMVKTPDEVALIRSAARKTEVAQLASMEAVAAGASWAEAQRVFFAVMTQIGGQPLYLAGTVARPGVGPLVGAEMHEHRPGDTAFFDGFGGYRHYFGDIGRTVVFGEPTEAQRRVFAALRAGWHDTWPQIRPGLDSRELAAMVMRHVRAAGAVDYQICSPHSVGLEHFDNPHPRSIYAPFIIESGTVLSVDVPYMAPDTGMLHTEDLVLVGEAGVEFLTSNDDRLCVAVDGSVHRVE
jgi:Xaa-Pro aminopeptidase